MLAPILKGATMNLNKESSEIAGAALLIHKEDR